MDFCRGEQTKVDNDITCSINLELGMLLFPL